MPSYSFAQQVGFVDNMNVASQRFANRTGLGTVVASLMGGAYPGGDYPGKIFYVSNITGTTTGDGLSWGTAFSTIALAVAAVIAFQAAQTAASLDPNVRCIIYIAGTLTAYASLTALPSHCDFIGVGDDPRGNGIGIARIGADAGAGSGVVVADTIRGVNFYNLQFQAGAAGTCFSVTNLYRSTFENCAFMANQDGAPTLGFTVAKGSGVVIRNCHFGSSANANIVTCLQVTGTHWHNCLIENTHFAGTNGIVLDAAVTSSSYSLVQHCSFTGGAGAQTSSIDDDSTDGRCSYAYNIVSVAGEMAVNGSSHYFANVVANETAFGAVTGS
jgi:hypothetical protein